MDYLHYQMCRLGLVSHPLPLVVGHNSRVGTTYFPAVAGGGEQVADPQFQRKRW